MLSEELAKYDTQMENATNKIIDVLRTLFKGDESRLKTACRIADRKYTFGRTWSIDRRTTGFIYNELSMLGS